ncbi:MAG: PilZ domain-containing protein, partial [Planctomycetes bacterium]|nr:PilZ domain-containing protein [Planctomycetota bacterium]
VVEFTLAHPMHGWSVRTPARIVRKVPQGPGMCLLGLQFINTGNLYAQLDDAMGRYFNRRRLGRVHPDENQTIDVHVSHGSNQILGRIYDLSSSGMGVAVPYVHGLELKPGMPLNIRFRLPNTSKTLTGEVVIRQRRMMGEYAFLGVILGEDFDSSQQVIEGYIETRRQEAEEFEHAFDEDSSEGLENAA